MDGSRERDPAGHDPANEPEDANQSHDAALQIVHLRSNAAIPFPLAATGERFRGGGDGDGDGDSSTGAADASGSAPPMDASPLGTSMSRRHRDVSSNRLPLLADTLHKRSTTGRTWSYRAPLLSPPSRTKPTLGRIA